MSIEAQIPDQPGSTYPPQEEKSAVSFDGEHYIDVPRRVEQVIRRALGAQEMIDERVAEYEAIGMDIEESNEGLERLIDLVKGLNCHKTILFLRGEMSLKEAVKIEYEAQTEDGTMRQKPETGGHPEVLSLMTNNPDKAMVSTEDAKEYLTSHTKEGPFSVHVLRKEQGDQGEEVWKPAHSFVFLGVDDAGTKLCFHKRGPLLRMRFELTSLDNVLEPYTDTAARILVLPINPQENSGSMQ